jgi:PAS domain S-box-containing protein
MDDLRYDELLDSVRAIVWRAEAPTFQTTFTSKQVEDILGFPAAAWTKDQELWKKQIHPEDRERVLEYSSQETMAGRKHSFDYRIFDTHGRIVWLRNIVNVIVENGEPKELVGISVDITEAKRDEEVRFRHAAIVESSDDAIIAKDLNCLIVSWNIGAQRIFGYTEQEALGQPIAIIIPPELWDEEKQILARVRAGAPVEHYETTRVTKTGKKVAVSLTISPIRDSAGKLLGFCKLAHDITERKQAEEALRESDERFRKTFRDAGVGMVIVSPDGRYLAANRKFCECLGYTEEELLTKTVQSITLPEDWPTFAEKLTETLTHGSSFQWVQKRCLHKSGRIVYTENSASLIRNRDGSPQFFVADVLDVTSRKEAEEALSEMTRKLVQAQEQERARIARELHDDINQRLAILGFGLDQLKDNPSEIESRVRELRRLTTVLASDVEALSHDLHSSHLEYLGVVAGIQSWCREFGERQEMKIEYRHNMQTRLSSEIGLCLFRVLQEALHNAAKHSGVKRVEVQLQDESGEIHLTVSDLGRGFDLRAVNQGKGLGLTSMRERVRLVNGKITIESQPMGGTTIHVRVPLESKHAAK